MQHCHTSSTKFILKSPFRSLLSSNPFAANEGTCQPIRSVLRLCPIVRELRPVHCGVSIVRMIAVTPRKSQSRSVGPVTLWRHIHLSPVEREGKPFVAENVNVQWGTGHYLAVNESDYPFTMIAVSIQRGANKISPCLKFPPHFCQAKWPAHAQPIGPDGTCVTKLSSINFARPCTDLLCYCYGNHDHVEHISGLPKWDKN